MNRGPSERPPRRAVFRFVDLLQFLGGFVVDHFGDAVSHPVAGGRPAVPMRLWVEMNRQGFQHW